MRNSGILKWAQNNKFSNGKNGGKEDKKWLHSPETLQQGNVVYLVKFLGSTEVEKPKGIEVVKQGIQKLKFNQQLKKSEGGTKTPKVELTISVEGVTIQEPKTKKMLHKYPLHKISYCADDKAEKRFFSFIAKEGDTSNHTCFVFVSDKLAEEITLTIGQAFELAYKKFLDASGKDMEMKKQLLVLQKRVALLENENSELKKRLKDVSNIKGNQDVKQYMEANNIADLFTVVPVGNSNNDASLTHNNSSSASLTPSATSKSDLDTSTKSSSNELINLDNSIISKLEGFTLDDLNDEDFNPRASDDDTENCDDDFDPRAPDIPAPTQPTLSPPPALPPRETGKAVSTGNYQQNVANSIFPSKTDDPFSQNPFNNDPFGMSSFESNNKSSVNNFLQPTTNFSLDELDPLKK